MTKDELTTYDKILCTGHKLFAEKGFNGVSIREIAKVADVNIAAINYHFGNKEKLYSETIKASMAKMSSDIEKISKSLAHDHNVEELATGIYKYFLENKEDLLTGFKLFLSSNEVKGDDFEIEEDEVGPPGGHVIFECLKREIPKASDGDLIWGVRIIFTQVIHNAVLVCNHCEMIQKRIRVDSKGFKDDILRLVRIVVKEIKQSS